MYLIVMEDGVVACAEELWDDDYSSCDDGLVSLVDVTDPDHPKEYYMSKWHPVEKLDRAGG